MCFGCGFARCFSVFFPGFGKGFGWKNTHPHRTRVQSGVVELTCFTSTMLNQCDSLLS